LQTQPVTVVVYPCDFSLNGAELGPETIQRLTPLRTLGQELNIAGLIMNAGFHPTRAYQNQIKTFGDMMRIWVSENTSIPDEKIFTNRPVWGTVGETLAAVTTIQEEKLPGIIHAVTSDYHLLRVKLTWLYYALYRKQYRSWEINFHGTPWDKPPTRRVEAFRCLGAICKMLTGCHGFNNPRLTPTG
jgi:hypothetical protein